MKAATIRKALVRMRSAARRRAAAAPMRIEAMEWEHAELAISHALRYVRAAGKLAGK